MESNLRISFEVGQKVRLDKEFRNTSIVEVVCQTPKKLFTTVKGSNGEYMWDVMTNRLTKLED